MQAKGNAENFRLVFFGTTSNAALLSLGCARASPVAVSGAGVEGRFGTIETPFSARRYRDIQGKLSQPTLAQRA